MADDSSVEQRAWCAVIAALRAKLLTRIKDDGDRLSIPELAALVETCNEAMGLEVYARSFDSEVELRLKRFSLTDGSE